MIILCLYSSNYEHDLILKLILSYFDPKKQFLFSLNHNYNSNFIILKYSYNNQNHNKILC